MNEPSQERSLTYETCPDCGGDASLSVNCRTCVGSGTRVRFAADPVYTVVGTLHDYNNDDEFSGIVVSDGITVCAFHRMEGKTPWRGTKEAAERVADRFRADGWSMDVVLE